MKPKPTDISYRVDPRYRETTRVELTLYAVLYITFAAVLLAAIVGALICY